MTTTKRKVRLALVAAVVAVVGFPGCSSEPAASPVDQRKSGQDITPEARTDKRGDVPVAPAANGK